MWVWAVGREGCVGCGGWACVACVGACGVFWCCGASCGVARGAVELRYPIVNQHVRLRKPPLDGGPVGVSIRGGWEEGRRQ